MKCGEWHSRLWQFLLLSVFPAPAKVLAHIRHSINVEWINSHLISQGVPSGAREGRGRIGSGALNQALGNDWPESYPNWGDASGETEFLQGTLNNNNNIINNDVMGLLSARCYSRTLTFIITLALYCRHYYHSHFMDKDSENTCYYLRSQHVAELGLKLRMFRLQNWELLMTTM